MATENTKIENDQNEVHSQDVKQFDDSKLGVKGLIDSGLTKIPRYFIHPPDVLSGLKPKPIADFNSKPITIPTIDLSGIDSLETRPAIVDQLARASREFGFFQIVNHSISVDFLDRLIASIKAFHEQPKEVKAPFYGRSFGHAARYFSNVDLFVSKAASWRDTLQVRLGPDPVRADELPEICREEVIEWEKESKHLAETLMGLLCEGLKLKTHKFKELTFSEGRVMVGHYYPHCPQPDLTVGITSHTDPGLITVLLQNQMGGLQIKHGDDWVDVKPLPGALVINVGDILQIISNGEYKSVDHRVLANPFQEPRISVAVFFNASVREELFGPLEELITEEKPAKYRQFTYNDYMKRFFTKELNGKTLTDYYRI